MGGSINAGNFAGKKKLASGASPGMLSILLCSYVIIMLLTSGSVASDAEKLVKPVLPDTHVVTLMCSARGNDRIFLGCRPYLFPAAGCTLC
eukprot:1139419-Pelagomonas_calceolata.AAC.5